MNTSETDLRAFSQAATMSAIHSNYSNNNTDRDRDSLYSITTIAKELLDNAGGWPEGYIPINTGHPLLHRK